METVVILHGLWMPGIETWLLRRRLAAAGFVPELYHYPTVTVGLDENIDAFARFLAGLDAPVVHAVGYSLGGVVCVGAAGRHPDPRPGRIVCLGSPLRGTAAGAALARLPLGAAIVGRSIRDLNARGGLGPWRGEREIACIAGSGGLGLGRVVASLDVPNDGTVGVSETDLPGLAAHAVVPVTHTTMMFDRRVADLTARFLRCGGFDDPPDGD